MIEPLGFFVAGFCVSVFFLKSQGFGKAVDSFYSHSFACVLATHLLVKSFLDDAFS